MRAERARARTAALVAMLIVGLPSGAGAYCRTSICPETMRQSQVCTPSLPSDCGVALQWTTGCISYSLQMQGSRMVPLERARAVFREAFATWTQAACPGGGTPRLVVQEFEPVQCDAVQYNRDTGNANAIVFRDTTWPHAGMLNSLALTTVTFDTRTGAILDADMEINATAAPLTTEDTDVRNDLRSIVTHEVGHFLGLAHSAERGATMEASYTPGSTRWRAIGPDDTAAICAVYPPGAALSPTCDAQPRRGFRSQCASSGGCSTRGPAESGGAGPWLAVSAVALAGALTRARSRARRELK